jgi:hypothetical protein
MLWRAGEVRNLACLLFETDQTRTGPASGSTGRILDSRLRKAGEM